MFPLTILVISVLMQGIMCIPPTPYYDSYGPNQLFVQEGEDVITVSGAEFLQGVSAEKCAIICDWMSSWCQCCNSFAFNPSEGTCYLKKRDSGSSNEVKYNIDGWQSYKYWDSVVGGYRGGLPEVVEAESVGADVGYPYEVAYISMGKNRNAKKEGEPIKTSQGEDFMSNSSPEQCADDCNAISDCDGFSYDPYQNGGSCFMKKNSQQKYETVYNSDGWTYYWKEQDWNLKCCCTCDSSYICVMCNQDDAKCEAL